MNVTLSQRVRTVRALSALDCLIPKGAEGAVVEIQKYGWSFVRFEVGKRKVLCAVTSKLGVDVEAVDG